MIDAQNQHFPDRIEIELHTDPDNIAQSIGISIPPYRHGERLWRQGLDTSDEIDVAVTASSFGLRFQSKGYFLSDARLTSASAVRPG